MDSTTQFRLVFAPTFGDLPNPGTLPEGTLAHTTDGECWVVEINKTTSAREWVHFCSPSGPTGSVGPTGPTGPTGASITGPTGPTGSVAWGNYVVASTPDIGAPFSTINAAITAAITAGHNAGNPATILIHPGNYAEDITLPAGIDLTGFDPARTATISGTVTIGTPGAIYAISNLTVSGQVAIAGVSIVVRLKNDTIESKGANPAIITLGTNTTSRLEITGSTVIGGGALAVDEASSIVSAFDRSIISSGSTTLDSMTLRGTGVVRSCSVTGRVVVDGAASFQRFVETDVTTTTSIVCIFLSNNALSTIDRCDLLTAFGGTAQVLGTDGTASASFQLYDYTANPGQGIGVAGGTLSAAAPTARPYLKQVLSGAGPFTIQSTGVDLMVLNNSGATTANLPPILNMPDGVRVTFARTATAVGAVGLVPSAGDTIAGSGATFSGYTNFVTLQVDRATRDWTIAAGA